MANIPWRRFRAALVVFNTALFCCITFSCIGIVSQVTLKEDGSGALKLEYRIAQDLENLGKTDGNERYLTIPVSKADFERSAQRIEGLTLVSYSSKQNGKDTIHTAQMAFSSIQALSAFFDSQGQRFIADLGQKRLMISFPNQKNADHLLGDKSGNQLSINDSFKELFTEALQGYEFSLQFTLPGLARVNWLDNQGKAITDVAGTCTVKQNIVSFTVPMADIVFLEKAQTMEVCW